MVQVTKTDRARELRRCRRPALASMEYSSIQTELEEISEACCDIHYFCDDERTLLDALDGDSEAEYEFQMAFAALDEKVNGLLDALQLLKSGVEVFASEGTANKLECDLITTIESGTQFQVGSMEIMPFRTWHDAKEPLGFLLYSRRDGERLVFATDTVNLGHTFPGVNLLALEAKRYAASLRCRCWPRRKHC